MDNSSRNRFMAWREHSRRAMSLLELVATVTILGVVAVASITRYDHIALGNGGAEGFARKLSLSLVHARRSTISTGDNHYLQLNSSGGSVDSYALIRRASAGDIQVDETRQVPADVTVTSGSSTLEFDFEGSSLAPYSVVVAGPNHSWTVSVVMLTGAVRVVENP